MINDDELNECVAIIEDTMDYLFPERSRGKK